MKAETPLWSSWFENPGLFFYASNCFGISKSWCVFIYLKILKLGLFLYMCSHKNLVFSYSLLVSMLSHSSVFTSPLGRSPPFWLSFPDMVAAVTIACERFPKCQVTLCRFTVTRPNQKSNSSVIFNVLTLNVASVFSVSPLTTSGERASETVTR